MIDAVRKRARDFAAITALILIALVVGGVILNNQRFNLPGWVPLVGKNFFTLKGEFDTAQAVTPGQGQTVTIAGVTVGEISKVNLHDGRALVSMQIKPKYAAVYRDAHMLLRPKTGLKDMVVELQPGTPTAGKLRSGGTVPIQSTLPDINPDEILASLDGDTRDYIKLLLGGAGEGLRGQARSLSATLRRFDPTARDARRITELLAQRRANLARVIHNFQLLSTELASKDAQISQFVSSSNAVFQRFANQDANIRSTLRLLPGALQETQLALGKADGLARALGPTLQSLRPTARTLGPTLRELRPFLEQTTPIIQTKLRPFSRAALPTVKQLRPAASDLAAVTPRLTTTFRVLNYALNELAFNKSGPGEEGFLFWLAWANHAGVSVFGNQDAHGPIRRGVFIASCSSLELLDTVAANAPSLSLLVQLTNAPKRSNICAKGS
ncbi:MAG: phospholipid/cholesterol/gamma-HCH transport system substrate-binding protein [Solirubrobacteraceae bacterium]|nr:phospholipid/cholesterol/gamma-HCH transport system substrate-binding protein [Solirubrobacteraceae bacterium]